VLSWRPTWLTWNCQVPPGSRAAGIAVSRAGRHIRTIVPPATVRPIRQAGKRLRQPRQDTRSRQPGGQGRMSRGSQLPRTSRAGHWLRLTAMARSGVLAVTRRLDPRHGRSWTGRKRTRVLRHLSEPDGRPVQAGVLRWVSNPPEMAVAHQPGLGRQVSHGDRLLHQATQVAALAGHRSRAAIPRTVPPARQRTRRQRRHP